MNALQRARIAKGWSAYRLAKESGVAQGSLAYWEKSADLGKMPVAMALRLLAKLRGHLRIRDFADPA